MRRRGSSLAAFLFSKAAVRSVRSEIFVEPRCPFVYSSSGSDMCISLLKELIND